jgi:RNase P subunit RPR2
VKVFKKIGIFVLLSIAAFSEAMLPVKGCVTFGEYEVLHRQISLISMNQIVEILNAKSKAVETLDASILNAIFDIRTQIEKNKSESERISKIPHMIGIDKVLLTCNIQLEKRLDDIANWMKKTFKGDYDLKVTDVEMIKELVQKYKASVMSDTVTKTVESVSKGNYNQLLGPFLLDFLSINIGILVPNTFVCAFTFVPVDDVEKPLSIYVNASVDPCRGTLNSSECSAFLSGEKDKDSERFCNRALGVQIKAIGGDLGKKESTLIGPDDLFRPSEQRAFDELIKSDFIESVKRMITFSVKEIIFHGHTLRDMCPNCRTTLVSHEIFTIRSQPYDSFLYILQNEIEKHTGNRPFVTCLISSFVEYQEDYRSKDIGWNFTPSVNLLNPNEKASSGICSNFVNLFAFSEKDFLEMLIPKLVFSGEAGANITAALKERLKQVSSSK